MIYSKEVQEMCVVAKGPKHGPAPIPEEGKWVKATEIKDISGIVRFSFIWRLISLPMPQGLSFFAPSSR